MLPLPLLLASPLVQGPLVVEMDKIVAPATAGAFSWGGSGIATDGETLVVGYRNAGTLEVYEDQDGTWVHVTSLGAPDAFVVAFPGSFDVDGDVIASGMRGGQATGTEDRVFTWRRVQGTWTPDVEVHVVEPSTHLAGFGFGQVGEENLALVDDTLVVGARNLSSGPPANITGTAIVFEYDGAAWNEVQRLAPADPSGEYHFGHSVDFDGDRIIVGDDSGATGGVGSGRAHVFGSQGGTWVEEAVLVPSGLGATLAGMGHAVGIEGDVAAMGNGRTVGEVDIFERVGASWIHRRNVVASGNAQFFGRDVEVDGSLVFVGADGRQGSFPENEGRVYVFSGDANQWNEAARIEAFDSFNGQNFGWNIDVADRKLVVAAPSLSNVAAGAAYGADVCPLVGTAYCQAQPNSSGLAARICAAGSPELVREDLRLIAHHVPAGSFGYFLASEGQDFVPLFAGSQGNLCLGGGSTIYRFSLFVQQSPNGGTVGLDVPWNLMPSGIQWSAGQTWNFQYWFRDANPGVTSNTTDATSIVFS